MDKVKQKVVLEHHAKLKALWQQQIEKMQKGDLWTKTAGPDRKLVDSTAETIKHLKAQIVELDEIDRLYERS